MAALVDDPRPLDDWQPKALTDSGVHWLVAVVQDAPDDGVVYAVLCPQGPVVRRIGAGHDGPKMGPQGGQVGVGGCYALLAGCAPHVARYSRDRRPYASVQLSLTARSQS